MRSITRWAIVVLATLCLSFAAGTSIVCAGTRDFTVYSDSLHGTWDDWSWSTTRNFANTSPVHSGTHSISVQHNAAWAGLYLHTDDHLTGADFESLSFFIHGGISGGHSLSLTLYDGSGAAGSSVSVQTTAGTWQQVVVTMESLGSPDSISGIVFQDATGASQPVYYLDEIAFVSVSGTPTPTPTPLPDPVLTVDAATDQHPIDPNIYGMNFADLGLAAEIDLPVNRWGGNSTTRYNWQHDISNRAMDWFYENIPNPNSHPDQLPDGSASDRFVEQNLATGTDTLMTVPLIGWTPKDRSFSCGFSVALYGPQQEVDPYAPDCGNGIDLAGQEIAGNNPLDTSVAIDETFVQDWISHLIGNYGPAGSGGVRYYNLDNEPMLWNDTHRDVHPQPASYDMVRDRIIQYGSAAKAADPAALTLGPVTWGWTAYFYSALDWEPGGAWWLNPQDRNAHGGVGFTEWLLSELQAYETAQGIRVLDYLDLHYYPQAPGVALSPAGSQTTQALRLRATRSLWDPAYTDESWINEPVQLLPRMQSWINSRYPGTKRAVTEYNFGGLEHINGAVTQAEVLGIFGQEGLDLACLWDPPDPGQPGAFAFKMFRNYDGAGSRFGDTGVRADSTRRDDLSIFAALNNDQSTLTVIIINKTFATLNSSLHITGFDPGETALGYRYDATSLSAIQDLGEIAVSGSTLTNTYPAQSITLYEMHAAACIHDGDVDGNGDITAADAQIAFLIALGAITPTYEQACSADCNGSGGVTAGDAQTIFFEVLGLGSCVD